MSFVKESKELYCLIFLLSRLFRNGHHEVYNASVQPVKVLHHPVVGPPSPRDDVAGAQDTLDNVSDISDGDIPDIPEPEPVRLH